MTVESPESRLPSVFITPLITIMIGVFLFIALFHGQRDLTLLTLLILGITIGARLWSQMSLSGTTCALEVDKDRVFPGESIALRVSAENAKFLPVWLRMSLPVQDGLRPLSGEKGFTDECGLLWYQKAGFTWGLAARRRGVYRVGPARMKVGDLLGFFPKEKKTEGDIHVVVYPRLLRLRPFSVPRRDIFGVPGARSPVQDPVFILGTRDYQPWHPARHIHWKASARYHRLQEKVFEPSEQEKLLLAVEVSQFERDNRSEDFERILEAAASLAVQSHLRGYALGFATNGLVEGGPSVLPIGRSPQQISSILEILARLKMKADGNLTDTLCRALRLPWGLGCVHFSYGKDQATRPAARYFSSRRIPMVFVVCASGIPGEQKSDPLADKTYCLEEILIEDT